MTNLKAIGGLGEAEEEEKLTILPPDLRRLAADLRPTCGIDTIKNFSEKTNATIGF